MVNWSYWSYQLESVLNRVCSENVGLIADCGMIYVCPICLFGYEFLDRLSLSFLLNVFMHAMNK